jgi:surface-adhesin protein E
MKSFLFAACAAATLRCFAANWQAVGHAPGDVAYVDIDSIRTIGRYVRAWELWDFDSQEQLDGYPPRKYKSAKWLEIFDCRDRTSGVYQQILFADNMGQGEAVDVRSEAQDRATLEEVAPDSIGEEVLDFVCSYTRSPADENKSDKAE